MAVVDKESLQICVKRKRASKPKVRSGCITCKARRVKCDEGKPSCARCTSTNRKCEGYQSSNILPLATRALLPKALSPGHAVEVAAEPQALEFFFLKTAPQLAGFFGEAFFQGTVLQRSLTEPAIRQAIGAIGFLHERTATGKLSRNESNLHIQLYNRSIRSVLKASSSRDSLSLVATASVLFACFEIFHGDRNAAATHVKSGIGLLQSWRGKAKRPRNPWGRGYPTSESQFMETKVAPLLSLFNLNILDPCNGGRKLFILNPVSNGKIYLTNQFEDLEEARNALLDMLAAATAEPEISHESKSDADIEAFISSSTGQDTIENWSASIDDLANRHGHSWSEREQRLANALYLIRLSTHFAMISYRSRAECDWDKYYKDYEALVRLCEAIVGDYEQPGDDFSRTMNIDCGLIFALHAGAWKCRWPKIRQHCLDLLLRIPKREWFFEAKHFHQIFTRIKEKEEEYLVLPLTLERDESCLPPEHVRIHNFTVELGPRSSMVKGSPAYAVCFWTKPHGLNGPWHCSTETMVLESTQAVDAAIPSNLLRRKA